MTQLFKTEADLMIATAGNVDGVNADVQGELNRLEGIVSGLRGSWAGAAQTSFDDLMVRYNEAAAKLQNALSDIADNLRSNASNFCDIEASNEQSFSAVAASGLNL